MAPIPRPRVAPVAPLQRLHRDDVSKTMRELLLPLPKANQTCAFNSVLRSAAHGQSLWRSRPGRRLCRKRLAADFCDAVELRPAFPDEPQTAELQRNRRRVNGASVNLERALANLLHAPRASVAIERTDGREGLQHHHIEPALQKFLLCSPPSCSCGLSTGEYAVSCGMSTGRKCHLHESARRASRNRPPCRELRYDLELPASLEHAASHAGRHGEFAAQVS